MVALVLSDAPDRLDVTLSLGDDNTFTAHHQTATGDPLDWDGAVTIQFSATSTAVLTALTADAVVTGADAVFTIPLADIAAIHTAKAAYARILVDGDIRYAGDLTVLSGWAGSANRTATAVAAVVGPAGPPGPPGPPGPDAGEVLEDMLALRDQTQAAADQASEITGLDTVDEAITALDANAGSDFRQAQDARLSATIEAATSLIIVNGGSVDLDDTKPDGYPVGYKATATTAFAGISFPAGIYIFVRDSVVAGGWSVHTVEAGTPIAGDTTAPTAGTVAGSAITETSFTLTVSGASDETELNALPYAFSTDNGSSWSDYQTSAVYAVTGKAASTGYQCKHRVKDAAGNVSTGSAITVTTTSAPTAPDDLSSLLAWWDADDAASLTLTTGRVDSWANQVSGEAALVHYSLTGPLVTADAFGAGLDGLVFTNSPATYLGGAVDSASAWTLGLIFKWNNTATDKVILAAPDVRLLRDISNALVATVSGSNVNSASAVAGGTGTHIVTLSCDGAGVVVIRFDGVKVTGAATPLALTGIALGAANAGDDNSDITVAEAWAHGYAISDGDHAGLRVHAQTKWGAV